MKNLFAFSMLLPSLLFAKRPGAFNDELMYIYTGLILCFGLYFLLTKLLKKKGVSETDQ